MEKEEKKKLTIRDLILPAVLIVLLIFLLVISVFFGGDKAKNPPHKSQLFYDSFDTLSVFYDYSGMSEEDFAYVTAIVQEKLDVYHMLFDIYHTYPGITNIKSLNDSAGDGAVKISAELFDFLEYSKNMYTLTGGEVNIAMGAVLSIWHDYRTIGKELPDISDLGRAAEHTDINSLILNRNDMTAELSDPNMKLDVGAIAKGYAAEKIAEDLKARGYTSFVLDLGGNLRAVGTKPNGDPWKTGVKNPDPEAENYIHEFYLSDASAVTSGDYERYYIVDGEKYHHIIDKDTLMPAQHFTSVTVITENSGLADALSTALFNMTYEEGVALADAIENIKIIWLTTKGQVIIYE